MAQSRRELIHRSVAAGAGLFVAGNLGALFAAAPAVAAPPGGADRAGGRRGVGELVPDPSGLLDLPRRFEYAIVSEVGEPTFDGGVLPDRFDGTSTFAKGRSTFLVRNHEQGLGADFPALAAPELTYDPACHGGTSTVEIDRRGDKVDEYVSLAGTHTNCAGGLTPWGTWLTCEETEAKAGSNGLTKDHGFVFEVDPTKPERNVTPIPLPALGRFAHEAATIDPRTGIVYLTEDAGNPNGLVYRCLPDQPLRGHGSLRAGGVLQAMRCTDGGAFVPDLSVYAEPGTRLSVGWVDVPDPVAATVSTRTQLPEVTRSRKFEGAWWGDGGAYIVCSYARNTDGSLGQHDGQVWRHDPARRTLTLELCFGLNPDPASDNPDGPDNITVSPWGGVILAEDGQGVQHLLAVTPDGSSFPFARNARDDSEFTGVTFSDDKRTLFANLQEPGVTFAITGPFRALERGV